MASEARGPAPTPDPGRPADQPRRSRLKRFGIRWSKRLGILALLGIILLVAAEHKTSKPEFCGSCHIMEPYHATWSADLHGSKLGVACVDCHYAPGERTTINAKLRGLSQVVSYFSGRFGKTRPRAYVDNLSCLTSQCHGDMRFMDKEITMGTVKFKHAKHLQFDERKKEAARQELQNLAQLLQTRLGKDRFDQLEQAALQTVHARDQLAQMTRVLADGAKAEPAELARFAQLHHYDVRVAQLTDLQCTNCHSYGGRGPGRREGENAHHFTVKTSSCITCHFTNESYNKGTASCLLCHALPTKEIVVHQELSPEQSGKLKSPELTKKTVQVDHAALVKRKVDCYACHADVARENTTVTRRDCERCHDRPEYFKEWKEPMGLVAVKHYHSVHVPEQRAKCLDCHSEIHHQTVSGDTVPGQADFLTTTLSNCTQCHPNQHIEQLQLLSGVGGAGIPKGNPNLMFGSRTNCFGCHTEERYRKHGGVSLRGGESGCVACHGDRHAQTFEKWKLGTKVALMDAEEAFENARKMLEKAQKIDAETRQKAAKLIEAAQADLQLVKRGNAVHNVMYSIDLLDSVTRRSQQALSLLAKASKKSP